MQNKHKKRICIITNALGGGGLERVAAMQSIYLWEINYKVFVVSNLDDIRYPFKGELLNLGTFKNPTNSICNRLKRFLILRRFLKDKSVDVIIDHRPRKRWLSEWLISNLLYKKPTIYVVHSHKVANYIPTQNNLLNRVYKRAKKVVCVSKSIEKRLKEEYGILNTETIYNPIDVEACKGLSDHIEEHNFEFILWYGRLDDKLKNLSLLIQAFKGSELPSKKIKLIILGDGPDLLSLKQKVSEAGLSHAVIFESHKTNPLVYVKSSKFVVLTSQYEGFPMVLPEALSCGVPVISVDCKSGPSEIIRDSFNGLLVKNNDEIELSNAMNSFINDNVLFNICKSNAVDSVRHLSIEKIRDQWINIIEDE